MSNDKKVRARAVFAMGLFAAVATLSAADVTVAGLNAPNGTLAVDSGTTVLTNGFDATLPESLATSAVLWFAADKNVITNESGGVTEWRDAREAANAETRLYNAALAYLPEEGEAGYEFRSELPVLVTTNKLFRPDTKAVDFGSYGSGRWLYFAAPGDTNRLRVTIGSFFTVVGFDNTCGHILGDVAALATGASGNMYFHKGLGSQTGGDIATSVEGNSVMHLGETRLNGTRIDPRNVAYNYNAFQLFSQNGPDNPSRGKPYASTFFNNANFKASNGGTLARQGGGTLVEFIAFARILSDAERREVEAYLSAKYYGVPVAGRVTVADGATLATGLDGTWDTYDRVAVLSDSCGAGDDPQVRRGKPSAGASGQHRRVAHRSGKRPFQLWPDAPCAVCRAIFEQASDDRHLVLAVFPCADGWPPGPSGHRRAGRGGFLLAGRLGRAELCAEGRHGHLAEPSRALHAARPRLRRDEPACERRF